MCKATWFTIDVGFVATGMAVFVLVAILCIFVAAIVVVITIVVARQQVVGLPLYR